MPLKHSTWVRFLRPVPNSRCRLKAVKRCCTCQLVLDESEFNKRAKSGDGLQSRCRSCGAANYIKNRSVIKPQIDARKKRNIEHNRKFVMRYLRLSYCVDCGEQDPIVLEFDHVRGKKKCAVSRLVSEGNSIGVLKSEIRKCEVRCCNCHRRVTFERLDSCYRLGSVR